MAKEKRKRTRVWLREPDGKTSDGEWLFVCACKNSVTEDQWVWRRLKVFGLDPGRCRKCAAVEKSMRWIKKNPDRYATHSTRFRLKLRTDPRRWNKFMARARETSRLYYEANKDAVLARVKKYSQSHAVQIAISNLVKRALETTPPQQPFFCISCRRGSLYPPNTKEGQCRWCEEPAEPLNLNNLNKKA